MIYITQLIYIKSGEEKTFDLFEQTAIPLISKYNGELLVRLRPENNSVIEKSNNFETPYEIHLVTFKTQPDFDNFMKDEARKNILHLKEQSIRESILINGVKI